ncbi:hypothetical protein RCH18_002799 [Flavobacterium sp. PL11]|nr:hypothetical protein [Flavobacterium sp. PL11]
MKAIISPKNHAIPLLISAKKTIQFIFFGWFFANYQLIYNPIL